MSIFKKNIILSPAVYDGKASERGILTVERVNNKVKGTLKCYNLSDLRGKMLLGVTLNNGIIHKFDLGKRGVSIFEFDLPADTNLDKKIACVVVNIDSGKHAPVVWGSTESNKIWKAGIMDSFQVQAESIKISSKSKQEPVVEQSVINNLKQEIKEEKLEEEYLSKEVETLIDKETNKVLAEFNKKSTKTNKQIKDFKKVIESPKPKVQSPHTILEEHEQEMVEEVENENELFYDLVREQVEELLKKFPQEQALEEIIPNSEFVRVDYNENSEFYVFGIIKDEAGEIEYIVYGVPAIYSNEPPNELEGYYQWLPLDINKPEEEGYWMMYQSGRTGENIRIEMV